jgi:hypothetical protein
MSKVAKVKVEFNPALLAAMHAAAPLNLAKATALADEYDTKAKSVIAKALREKIPYEKQVRVRKDGKPVASKEATVGKIEEALGADVGAFDGLEKASKASLEAVFAAIQNAVESDEGDEADAE